ncbi:uncharacterized protein [Physcomitrium patens]|uniref:Bifunctional inhibitor/plant lipid transfer protein/seed storage helical domain-containing protein n=1 Tax=Physcomitrium patens TaxID=3218 RepID=A0A7I4FQ34_PHYPA
MAMPKRSTAAASYGVVGALLMITFAMELVSGLYLCPTPLEVWATLESCMPSIEGPRPVPPNAGCCYVIRTTEPSCYCNAFAGYENSPSINERYAMSLPEQCGRVMPANFTCNGIRVPSSVLPPGRKLKLF